MAQKTLLARKGEAKPAESEAFDGSGAAAPDDASARPLEGDDKGFLLLREESSRESPSFGELARDGRACVGDDAARSKAQLNLGSAAGAYHGAAAQSFTTPPSAADREFVEAYRAPSGDEAPFDKAVAGSLLDFRLIRGRERRVCPGATEADQGRDDGPKVHIPSLGPASAVPRRAASSPQPAPATLPQPLPLSRQGDSSAADAASHGQAPQLSKASLPKETAAPTAEPQGFTSAPQVPSTITPTTAPTTPTTDSSCAPLAAASPDAPSGSESAAGGDVPLPRRVEAVVAPPVRREAASLPAVFLARALGYSLQRLRALPAALSGTPHLAYLAGLLVLCAFGGIYFILTEDMPADSNGAQLVQSVNGQSGDSETAAGASSSLPSQSTQADAAATASVADKGVAEQGIASGAEDGSLSLGGLKAAPVLSSEEADAVTGVSAATPLPLGTEAGPDEAAAAGAETDVADAASPTTASPSSASPSPASQDAAFQDAAGPTQDAVATAEEPASQDATSPPAAVAEGDYTVQFYAARDRASAERAMGQMETNLAKVLGGRGLHISEATSSSGRAMYRVRSEGFAEAAAAKSFCDAAKKAGQDCLVLKRQ